MIVTGREKSMLVQVRDGKSKEIVALFSSVKHVVQNVG